MSNSTILIKYWFEVSEEEQRKRFLKPIEDPMRQWKLSPMDLESHRRWYDYSRAKDAMLAATDTPQSLMTFRPNGIFPGVHSAVQAFLKVERPAQASAAALGWQTLQLSHCREGHEYFIVVNPRAYRNN